MTMNAEIKGLDKRIDAVRAQVRPLVADTSCADCWQYAWDCKPELLAEEKMLFILRADAVSAVNLREYQQKFGTS